MSANHIRCSALVVQCGPEEMRWILCELDGCGYTTAIRCALDGSGITTEIKCTQHPPHLLKSTTAQPVQNTVCGLSSFTVLLIMGIMMPEIC
jgi:hypothetical protein